MEEKIYVPSGIKYAVSMTCEGFDMDLDDWTIRVVRGTNVLTFTRDNSIHEEGAWYICVDTSRLGPGKARIIFDASVPDDDFPNGIRREVSSYDLTDLSSLPIKI